MVKYACIALAVGVLGCSRSIGIVPVTTATPQPSSVETGQSSPQVSPGEIHVEIMNATTIRLVRRPEQEGASTIVLEYLPETNKVVIKNRLITEDGSNEDSTTLNLDADEKTYMFFKPLFGTGDGSRMEVGAAELGRNVVWTPRIDGSGDATLEFDVDGDGWFEDVIRVPSIFEHAAQ